MIPAIILSGGASKRMGSPKALLPVGGKTLLEDQISRLIKAGCGPIVVVIGADANIIVQKMAENSLNNQIKGLDKVFFTINDKWELGQFSSIKCGFKSIKDHSKGCLLLPVDVPFVPANVIKKILSKSSSKYSAIIPTFLRSCERTSVRAYEKGHPIWLSQKLIKKILPTDFKTGRLDKLLEKEEGVCYLKTTSPAILNNINTPKEWKSII